MKINENKGITLVTLTITVIVLAIIAGITVYTGVDTVKRANLESLRTNMLLIQAKAKEYVEEADFKMGPAKDTSKKEEVYRSKGLVKANESSITISAPEVSGIVLENCYHVTKEALNEMGLGKIAEELDQGEEYLIKPNEEELSVEVYNTIGYQGKYSLTDLEELQ